MKNEKFYLTNENSERNMLNQFESEHSENIIRFYEKYHLSELRDFDFICDDFSLISCKVNQIQTNSYYFHVSSTRFINL